MVLGRHFAANNWSNTENEELNMLLDQSNLICARARVVIILSVVSMLKN